MFLCVALACRRGWAFGLTWLTLEFSLGVLQRFGGSARSNERLDSPLQCIHSDFSYEHAIPSVKLI